MGCINSKKKKRVGAAPIMKDEDYCTPMTDSPTNGIQQRSSVVNAEDGRKSALAFVVSLDGRNVNGLIRQHPPKKLQRLEPEKDIVLSAEVLWEKQHLAEAKRERELQKRLETAQATSRRLKDIARMRESEPKPTTHQLDSQLEAAQRMREIRQREIVEKQRLREERAKQVRQKRYEPLNEERLAADVKFETNQDLSMLKRPETPKQMTRRQMELLQGNRAEKKTTIDSISAQLEAAQKAREARQREIVEKQRLRAEHAKLVRERRSEPLSEKCLAADIAIDRKEKALRSKENIQKNMELLTKRRHEFVKAKEHEQQLSKQDVKDKENSAAQIERKLREAELKREHLKNEVILKQRLQAVRASQVRRRVKKANEDLEELSEIECDPGNNEGPSWNVFSDEPVPPNERPADFDPFFDA